MSDGLPDSIPAPLVQPPLGVSHLLLWIFGAAVVLGVYRLYMGTEEPTPAMQSVLVGSQLVFSLAAGINIAAVVVYARRLIVRDAPLPAQPGHWLLAVVGISNIAMWVFYGASLGLIKLWGIVDPVEMFPYFCFTRAAGYSLLVVLNAFVAVWIREPARWRLMFLLSAVFSGLLAVAFWLIFASTVSLLTAVDWYPWLYYMDQIVGIILLAVNAIADGAQAKPRDWVHRVGVASTMLQLIASLVFQWLMQWVATAAI